MLDRAGFDAFCAALPATSHVVQWGGSSIWKVGGKIFAIMPDYQDGPDRVSFKATDIAFEAMPDQHPDIIPAPYLARHKWLQVQGDDAMSDEDVCAYIRHAHKLVAASLTKKKQRELGLLAD